jgi:hypothetical protein
MSYYLDLKNILLDDYKEIIMTSYLIPSQLVLREDIDTHFNVIKNNNFRTLEELYLSIKTKKKALLFAEKLDLDESYIIVLRRSVSSYIAKPRLLNDYPFVTEKLEELFKNLDLKKSDQLYDYLESNDAKTLSLILNLSEEDVNHLKYLMDVTRLRYVSPLFATVLVEAGYSSISLIADASIKDLHEAILRANKEKSIYKGNIGHTDSEFLIEDAKMQMKFR